MSGNNNSSGGKSGGIGLTTMVSGIYAYFNLTPYFASAVGKGVAALGVGLGTSFGGGVGALGGAAVGGGAGALAGGRRNRAIGATVGAVMGGISGFAGGVYGGYSLTYDFMVNSFGDEVQAEQTIQAPGQQAPDASQPYDYDQMQRVLQPHVTPPPTPEQADTPKVQPQTPRPPQGPK